MKKSFTKLFSTVLVMASVLTGFTAKAQETTLAPVNMLKNKKTDVKADSIITVTKTGAPATVKVAPKAEAAAWVPVRRLWGYAFGDLYYNQHADATNRGPESMYNGVPTNRNAFQFRRAYIGYDYDIDQKFTAEVLLASEPNANTGVNGTTAIQNGDDLVDGKMAFFIKNFNLRYRNIWNGTDIVVGEMSTPGFALNEPGTNAPTSLSEATWGNRFIEKTITDVHKNNSYDIGAALQGTFDPKTKNFGYVFMVGNNTSASLLPAANPNTGFYKIFYGDLWGKFFNKQLYVDIYSDYAPTAPATAAIGGQSHSLNKIFAAYVNPKFTIGVEAYTQKITNGVTNSGTKNVEDATVNGLSIWIKGVVVKDKINFFARRDGYNPDTKFDGANSYTVNTNYGSYNPTVKETFYTAGLDFTPAPKIHFSPNVWLIEYKDQRSSTTTGYVGNDHNLVYRATFFYTFGK
ncbi:hypothetical protein [Mucilaginibacter sp.]|uniref:hypothetical protein n=1 Tax=Mucilaginibacter sp. TaxID=1882438 RepID=UPI00261C94AE|nr:hypothetical protein [Mucilaginibacter sp.]MDB4926798.1 hypothetical protein [Mucilaginibacter sp.]